MSEQLYTQRHNRVYNVIHWHICKNFDVPVPENLWEHEPTVITENIEVTTAHILPNDPKEREQWRQSIATGYHTSVQKTEKNALLVDELIPEILDEWCRNQENDQTARPQEWSEKILEAEECQSCTSDDEESHRDINNHPGNITTNKLQLEAVLGSVTILKRALGTKLLKQKTSQLGPWIVTPYWNKGVLFEPALGGLHFT